jgi:hypothetical protein
MGTSSPANAPNNSTPLVPTWLDDPGPAPPPSPDQPDVDDTGQPQPDETTPPRQKIPKPHIPKRFTSPRTGYTNFLKSGDGRSLRRSLHNYVRSGTGGASNAVRRMGSAPSVAGRTLGFFRAAYSDGVSEALRNINLSYLEGQPADLILSEVMDVLCPPGGPIDEAISRDAFVEATEGIESLDGLNSEQVRLVFIRFVARSIFGRILIDIGNNSISLPRSPDEVEIIQNEILAFIGNVVEKSIEDVDLMSAQNINELVDSVYQDAFELMESLS